MGMKKKAAALRWDPEKDEAPRMIASGKGLLAEKILAIAEKQDIPVLEQGPLADALSSLDPGQTIPPELFLLAAEVYAFLADLDESGYIGGAEHPGQQPGDHPA